MKISTKGRYALRVMVDLSQFKGQYISLNDISNRQGISLKYLETIIQVLVKNQMVLSKRGKEGGYMLSHDPSEYKVYDILNSLEGSLVPVECLLCDNECTRKSSCKTFPFWQGLDKTIEDYLKKYTLEDLSNKNTF